MPYFSLHNFIFTLCCLLIFLLLIVAVTIIGLVVVVALVAVVLLMVLACSFRKKIFCMENPTHRIIEGFLKEHGPLPTTRYSYSEVKKMTNSFRNKLGQGGFGSVYKGKLHDGQVVAVKILNKSEGNGEEFFNEVASISKTSHVNIVRRLVCRYGLNMGKMHVICPFYCLIRGSESEELYLLLSMGLYCMLASLDPEATVI